jgi:subtilisin family serine protease
MRARQEIFKLAHGFVLLLTMAVLPIYSDAATSAQTIRKSLPSLTARLQRNEPVIVIVEMEAAAIETQSITKRKLRGISHDDAEILKYRSDRYRADKDTLFNKILPRKLTLRRDYSHLPMFTLRLNSITELNALEQDPLVSEVYEEETLHLHLAESASLIGQPQAATLGQTGEGTTIAVLDTGVNYTLPTFGSCSAPAVPSNCKVIYAQDFAPDDGALDANGHGSNVAAIVSGIAPATKIAALDVIAADGSAYSSDIVAAINWAIANRLTYNIVALNMSLGGGLYTSACNSSNPFRTPIVNAKTAGILTIASSGNDASSTSIAMPACTTGAVSVGAVYDGNVGARSWSTGPSATCSDPTTAADQVSCFSNSASFLNLLAPGALITAAGVTYAGTSQAAPHVSGAVAVLRAAYPAESLTTTLDRLTTRGVNITDTRNHLVKPRIDLLASLGAVNDNLATAGMLSGQSGTVYAATVDASKESLEPNHAGNLGGKSVWWNWTAPLSGPLNISTAGSDFNTLLAVYTGGTLGALSLVSANDDNPPSTTSSLNFIAQAGTSYQIAVDGFAGASGTVKLSWNYLDSDNDGVIDALDNCLSVANLDQADFDSDSLGNACDPDDDNDAMPDDWEIANGLNPLDPSDAIADPDGDGSTNLEEYLRGTNPHITDPMTSTDSDIPLMPPWAMAVLASVLVTTGLGRRSSKASHFPKT